MTYFVEMAFHNLMVLILVMYNIQYMKNFYCVKCQDWRREYLLPEIQSLT